MTMFFFLQKATYVIVATLFFIEFIKLKNIKNYSLNQKEIKYNHSQL
jgi:preprotein translocase subunit SecG